MIFVKTNFTPKNMIIFLKNRGPRSKLPHWTKLIYSYVTITCTNKKITCMTHVVKIDILTGYEENGILHFIL